MADSTMAVTGLREKRLPRRAKEVQNKAPAPQQITAEQILREAHEMQFEKVAAPPRQQITDPDELRMYKLRKRRKFENTLRRNRMSIGVWLKYAHWEESQKEFERARSIFERIIDIDYQSPSIWLKYSEMEMKNGFISRARNVWDRAVQLLPRIDQLWFKYAFMEEKLGNFEGARRIFERWMKWNPPQKAWFSYIDLEMRSIGKKSDKMNRCRKIFDRFIEHHCNENAFIKYAEWEYKKCGNCDFARTVYEKAIVALEVDDLSPNFFRSFCFFEVSCKEYERARAIFKYALDYVPKYKATELFEEYMLFEKRYGDKSSIDLVILNKKRFEYEQNLVDNEHDYDLWFDYLKLEEQNLEKNDKNYSSIREIYERAISATPPIVTDKRYWKRYIYLWIKYAIFEELITKNIKRARAVWSACLKVIPHKNFTFGKVWIMFSEFEIRRGDIKSARLILGEAIGRCPKENVFNAYIQIEYELGEFNRCRKIYEKMLECFSSHSRCWNDYALLEDKLDEYDRAKAIYELGIAQDVLDEPQELWQNYIKFETKRKNYANVRNLFERLLKKTQHVRVWINFAQFEAQINEPQNARSAFKRGENDKGIREENEARCMLLEAWNQFEAIWGNDEQQKKIKAKQPHRIKKRRAIQSADGTDAGYEEYYDYRFPDDQKQKDSLNALLERAKKWKQTAKNK